MESLRFALIIKCKQYIIFNNFIWSVSEHVLPPDILNIDSYQNELNL
jgi:hypothetical protein